MKTIGNKFHPFTVTPVMLGPITPLMDWVSATKATCENGNISNRIDFEINKGIFLSFLNSSVPGRIGYMISLQ